MKKYVNDQLVDMTADEIAARQAEEQAWADGASDRNLTALRKERNYKLAETDWWASSDLTMTDAQKKYRQDLRDITKSATSLDDVTWPEKP
jgi:hypothetical protein